MDLGPTILDLAGIETPDTMEAITMLPAMKGEAWDGRPYVYAEQAKDGILTHADFMTMVRSDRWKIVHFLDEPYGQLFDMKNDPQEVNNLWDCPDHQNAKQEMLAELREGEFARNYKRLRYSKTIVNTTV